MRLFAVLTLSLAFIILALLIAVVNQYSLIKEPQIIELYFTDSNNLPDIIPSNNLIDFSFSIKNKGLQEESLTYLVIIKNNEDKIISSNSVLLKSKQTTTLQEKFTVDQNIESALISVELLNKNQEIHFWVRRNGS